MSQKTLSGQAFSNRTMNGIISLSDGQGSTIENGQITTNNIGAGSINANTVTANNLLQADDDEIITGAWDFQTLPYSGLAPFGNFELTNKLYVDDSITNAGGNYINLTTDQTAGGIKTFSDIPKSAGVPVANDDVTNKLYVDNHLAGQFVNLTTNQTVGGVKLFSDIPQSAGVPVANNDIPNKLYVDNHLVGSFIDLVSNQTVTSGVKVFNDIPQSAGVPSVNADIANKLYVDNEVASAGSGFVNLTTNQTVNGTKTFGALRVNQSQSVILKNCEYANFSDGGSFDIANTSYADKATNPALFQSNVGVTQVGGSRVDFKVSGDIRARIDENGVLEQEVRLANGDVGLTQTLIIDKKGTATTRNLSSTSTDNIIIGDGCFLTGIGGDRNIAIGKDTMKNTQGQGQTVAIGYNVGVLNGMGNNSVGIGVGAFGNSTNGASNSVGIGPSALYNSATDGMVGIGSSAGYQGASTFSTSVGYNSGYSNAGSSSCNFGVQSGNNSGVNSVNIGGYSGANSDTFSVNIGYNTGANNSGYGSVSIGHASNQVGQGASSNQSVCLGFATAQNGCLTDDINIGSFASRNAINSGRTQGRTINIGYSAAQNTGPHSGFDTINIGTQSAVNGAGDYSICIGRDSGFGNINGNGSFVKNKAIAIGVEALGNGVQGTGDVGGIGIGYRVGRFDVNGIGSHSIGINGYGNRSLEMPNSEAFYVSPIRYDAGTHTLRYNNTTKEITFF